MKNPVLKATLQGMLLDGLFWAGYCSFGSFIIPFLLDSGFSESSASIVMTMISTISFLVQPLTGHLCDTHVSQRQVYLTLSACSVPLLLLLPHAAGNAPLTLLIMFFLTVSLYQVPGLVDSWIIHMKKQHPALNYGLPRGTGSLVFAATAQIMGTVTVRYGHGARFLMGAVILACSMGAAYFIRQKPPVSDGTVVQTQGSAKGKAPVSLLLQNKTYLLVLGITFLALAGTSCVSAFLPMLANRLGGDSGTVGSCLAVAALCEAPPMFLMGSVLKRIRAKYTMLFASFFYIFRLALHLVVPNVGALIGIQVFQGLSFAVLWPSAVNYINDIVDERIKATAIMTFTSVGLGVSNIFGNALGAALLPIVGVYGVFAVCTGLTVLAFLLALLGFARKWWI